MPLFYAGTAMRPRVPVPLILLFVVATPLLAGYSGRDLFIPVVGRGVGYDGRVFGTTLWLTNVSPRGAAVTLTYMTMAAGAPRQHESHVRLAPGETKLIEELGSETFGTPSGNGALHVQSDGEILANARLSSRMAGQSESFGVAMACAGIPAGFAVGNGDTATLQGVASGDYRYKIYIIETVGQPLAFAISLLDTTGRERRRRVEYVAGHEHRILDVHDLFPNVDLARGIVKLTGVNGNGRIIAGGAQITNGTVDGTFFEMSMETRPRWRMPGVELGVYVVLGVALLVAAARGWGGRGLRTED